MALFVLLTNRFVKMFRAVNQTNISLKVNACDVNVLLFLLKFLAFVVYNNLDC